MAQEHGTIKELPDMSGVAGKSKLKQYLVELQKHLDDIRRQANLRRLDRQTQRQLAGHPPGNHEYMVDDLVFVHDDAVMKKNKFQSRQMGTY